MGGRTPAQLYALVFGAVLLLVGIIGFFIDGGTSFAVGQAAESEKGTLLLFDVNGWHNLVHVASGAVGLAMAGSPASARIFAIGFGVVYALVTVLGLALDSPILQLIPINGADNVLHLLIAVIGIAAGLASPKEPAPSTA
jgi:hypothetical protein